MRLIDGEEWGLEGETKVLVAGDWHSNRYWISGGIARAAKAAPGVRTILQLGDFGYFPGFDGSGVLDVTDEACAEAGIERVLVTPGNHEDWAALGELFAEHPGEAVRLSESVWMLPPGIRFTLGGQSFLSFGGAASVDFGYRKEGTTWWPAELPDAAAIENTVRTLRDSNLAVLLTHETVDGGARRVSRMLEANSFSWPPKALTYSATSRDRITRLWNAVHPQLLAHGHMHVEDEITLADGRRVYSLAADGREGNFAVLGLASLDWTWIRHTVIGTHY